MNKQWSPLLPVSRLRIKCPACGKRDNCAVSADGCAAFCRRVRSDRPGQGGWTHILTDGPQQVVSIVHGAAPAPIERAPVAHRDGIYCALLRRHLTLSNQHRVKLRARELSDEEIERLSYKSAPTKEPRERITAALSAAGLEGVPGFYLESDSWRVRYTPRGIFIPHRDSRGRIEGLQYRPDEPGDAGKYRWFSTNPELTDSRGRPRYPDGAASGAPPHHANHHLLADAEVVTVTEGALKADVIAYFTQAPVIGIAGVSTSGRDFADRLKESAPRVRLVRVAYDRDLSAKREVRFALAQLCGQLQAAGFTVRVLMWPAPWKGFDDYLVSQFDGQGLRAA